MSPWGAGGGHLGECNTATLRVLRGHIKPRMVQSPTFVPELEETPMYWESFRKNDIFSFELELNSVVANPKGGNRAFSIRIRAR